MLAPRAPGWKRSSSVIAVLLAGCGNPASRPESDASTGGIDSSSSGTETSPSEGSSAGDGTGTTSADTGDSGPDSTGSDDTTTGGAPLGCAVVEVEGECGPVTDCIDPATPFQAQCDGPPSEQCCVPAGPPCSVDGAPGLCISVDSCGPGLQATPGLCPGDASIQCCTDPLTACDPEAMPTPNEGLVEESWDPACPPGMVLAGEVCIDRFEAALVVLDGGGAVIGHHSPYFNPGTTRVRAVSLAGAIPQGYINQVQAADACDEAGKRLCTDLEWLRACQGASGSTYPWGNVAEPGRCNDARSMHPAIEYFGTSDPWIWSELGHPCLSQLPRSLHVTGQHDGCISEDGALDMMGNLHEWTADPTGTFRGGFYVDTVINGPGCLYATTAHDVSHWDYSTGFRCCADP
ncbi:MAG: SUMF1/EgtB/PvdO family nonheme iron enzyme [Myxococcales bacterium]|nr:SUMF1/EgtB/PvdO family nonheme iron enzyme [Myxococcales bacterium]